MSNILQELEAEIKKATASVSQENVGVIRSVGDGVAKIEGLSGVMLNEMIGHAKLFGQMATCRHYLKIDGFVFRKNVDYPTKQTIL